MLPAAAAIALGLGTVQLIWAAGRALALVVLAVALAASVAPLVARLARHMPRGAAVAVVYAGGAAMLIGLGSLTLPGLGRELQALSTRLPDAAAGLQQQLRGLLPDSAQAQQAVSGLIAQLTSMLQRVPARIATFAFDLLVIVFLSMYLVTVAPRLSWFTLSLVPRRHRRRTSLVLCRMAAAMGGYFRGVAIDAVIIGALTWTALQVLDVEFALPLAVLAACGEFVPYAGPVFAAIPAIAIALLQSPQQALAVGGVYLALQQLEGHVVTPNVMHAQTEIRPATVIVALTTGYAVGGVVGAVAAIPIFAAGRVLLVRVTAPALRRAARRVPAPPSEA